jgi:hypothetical protein
MFSKEVEVRMVINNTKGMTSRGAVIVLIAALIIAVPIATYLFLAPPRIVTETVTEPTSLEELQELIEAGDIDVGTVYDMNVTARYHTIHGDDVLGLDCASCHVAPEYSDDYLYQRKYKEPGLRDSPGIVDRATCLSCHKAGGIPGRLYGTAGDNTGDE